MYFIAIPSLVKVSAWIHTVISYFLKTILHRYISLCKIDIIDSYNEDLVGVLLKSKPYLGRVNQDFWLQSL